MCPKGCGGGGLPFSVPVGASGGTHWPGVSGITGLHCHRGNALLVDESGTVAPLLTSAASAPWRPSPAGEREGGGSRWPPGGAGRGGTAYPPDGRPQGWGEHWLAQGGGGRSSPPKEGRGGGSLAAKSETPNLPHEVCGPQPPPPPLLPMAESGTVIPLLNRCCFCPLASLPRRRWQRFIVSHSLDREVLTTTDVTNVTRGRRVVGGKGVRPNEKTENQR